MSVMVVLCVCARFVVPSYVVLVDPVLVIEGVVCAILFVVFVCVVICVLTRSSCFRGSYIEICFRFLELCGVMCSGLGVVAVVCCGVVDLCCDCCGGVPSLSFLSVCLVVIFLYVLCLWFLCVVLCYY